MAALSEESDGAGDESNGAGDEEDDDSDGEGPAQHSSPFNFYNDFCLERPDGTYVPAPAVDMLDLSSDMSALDLSADMSAVDQSADMSYEMQEEELHQGDEDNPWSRTIDPSRILVAPRVRVVACDVVYTEPTNHEFLASDASTTDLDDSSESESDSEASIHSGSDDDSSTSDMDDWNEDGSNMREE